MKKLLFFSFISSIVIACSPKTTEVAEVKKVEATMPSRDVTEGNSLYQAHCGKCHELPVVSKYSKEKWQKIIPPMCKESKLDAMQETKISAYVNWKLQQQ